MTNTTHTDPSHRAFRGCSGERGVSAVELAIILPLLFIIVFAIIDFGRLIQARLVVTNLAREGGSLAARDIKGAADLITMLQAGASPLDISGSDGKIYIWKIKAGTTAATAFPTIGDESADSGGLSVSSSVTFTTVSDGYGHTIKKLSDASLSSALYAHLVFHEANNAADISGVTVVEVFYKYTPITPLSNFIHGLLTGSGGGKIINSRAVF